MENLRSFFQAFSEIKGFDNWMIGKIRIKKQEKRPDGAAGVSCRETKRKQRFAVLKAEGQGLSVEVSLLRPVCDDKTAGGKKAAEILPENCMEFMVREFSAEEIRDFAKETGDDNPIHFSALPVTPGFLMLEWLWQLGYLAEEMIFYAPVYAQERITLYVHQETGDCYAVSDYICWKAQGKWKRGK